MSDFWPSGLELDNAQSPMEILKSAQEQWEMRSDGQLRLTFGFDELSAGIHLLPMLLGIFVTSQIIKDALEIDRRPEQELEGGTYGGKIDQSFSL